MIFIGPAVGAPAVDVETVGGAADVPGADDGPPLHAAARGINDTAEATAAMSRVGAYSIWIMPPNGRETWLNAR
ncbi:hypothetical protein [Mycobacterium sp. AZCC_0083]|uniref:hypothetical protein n=1 Tax=Mycobacterium sp. AZCC_0083 TaxID=2735882 RepID=UPI001616254D|nr:hypothetical protein [Mycobacterium sp. AZCC_0083]MBB5165439.1 hypothetical protein [Mycobacterium sp. AZCC_0083]